MKKSTKKMIVWIALAALGGMLLWWWWQRRKKAQAAEAAQTDTPAPPVAQATPPPPPLYIRDDVEALARVVASEAGAQPRKAQMRIAWVARNRAAEKKTSISALVCSPCGRQVGNRRPFSTRLEPTAEHREVAAYVLATPRSDDPTKGATHMLLPSLMDRQFAAGKAKHDARAVRRSWLRSLDFYGSAHGWDFFGPKGGPGAQPVPEEWGIGPTAIGEQAGLGVPREPTEQAA
jgi:hypothetical protein